MTLLCAHSFTISDVHLMYTFIFISNCKRITRKCTPNQTHNQINTLSFHSHPLPPLTTLEKMSRHISLLFSISAISEGIERRIRWASQASHIMFSNVNKRILYIKLYSFASAHSVVLVILVRLQCSASNVRIGMRPKWTQMFCQILTSNDLTCDALLLHWVCRPSPITVWHI